MSSLYSELYTPAYVQLLEENELSVGADMSILGQAVDPGAGREDDDITNIQQAF